LQVPLDTAPKPKYVVIASPGPAPFHHEQVLPMVRERGAMTQPHGCIGVEAEAVGAKQLERPQQVLWVSVVRASHLPPSDHEPARGGQREVSDEIGLVPCRDMLGHLKMRCGGNNFFKKSMFLRKVCF